MPNKDTPAKHKTPNYKLVRHENMIQTLANPSRYFWQWDAMPLRADRKDIAKPVSP